MSKTEEFVEIGKLMERMYRLLTCKVNEGVLLRLERTTTELCERWRNYKGYNNYKKEKTLEEEIASVISSYMDNYDNFRLYHAIGLAKLVMEVYNKHEKIIKG
jgi:hypothetical protein